MHEGTGIGAHFDTSSNPSMHNPSEASLCAVMGASLRAGAGRYPRRMGRYERLEGECHVPSPSRRTP